MNPKRQKKLLAVVCFILLLGAAAGLILYALKQNINLFYTPTQLLTAQLSAEQNIRVGGYVKKKSVQYDASGEGVSFVITDRVNEITVKYQGVLPNLFKEGQGIVVTAKLNAEHALTASEVLAKHDEKYMPKAVADELKKGEHHDT